MRSTLALSVALAASTLAFAASAAAVDTEVDGEASARSPQEQSATQIVVEAKVKAKEDLQATGTGKVLIRRRDGCLVGRGGDTCKVGYKLERVDKRVRSGDTKMLKLKPTEKGNKRLSKVVAKGRKATGKLKVKLSDEAGNKATTKLKIMLRPAH